ncbi:MAG: class I SAM-dependent methyltransferase [Puniceicoccales bacterium]|jgi:ubiquinone/menaquinone biosynthesis C-methylase UbiE|nr:class I SAM-dependent methyltransferase [Puniceicoccales bacterium]
MPTTLSNAAFFGHPDTVLEYARAAANLGLWESERLLCEASFSKDAPLLELGCGAGRIAFGLQKAGWRDITATDFSPQMLEAARAVADANADANAASDGVANAAAGDGFSADGDDDGGNGNGNGGGGDAVGNLRFAFADATALPFADAAFASVIFGFNGLMMIPLEARREAALREMHRVLRTGGTAIFTGHERNDPRRAAHWDEERARWAAGTQNPALERLGDYDHTTPAGRMFIHAATRAETHALALRCGFAVEFTAMRSEIATESREVREFSDDTRFWVLRKPM